jgi:hypothetical protein
MERFTRSGSPTSAIDRRNAPAVPFQIQSADSHAGLPNATKTAGLATTATNTEPRACGYGVGLFLRSQSSDQRLRSHRPVFLGAPRLLQEMSDLTSRHIERTLDVPDDHEMAVFPLL